MNNFKIFLTIALLAAIAFSASPTGVAVDAVYESDLDLTISSADNFDSLKTSADSSTLFTLKGFKQGYEYILALSALTGTSVGSTNVNIYLSSFDANKAVIFRDSIHVLSSTDATNGAQVILPVRSEQLGNFYTCKLVAKNGGSLNNIQINKAYIYRRRLVSNMKRW